MRRIVAGLVVACAAVGGGLAWRIPPADTKIESGVTTLDQTQGAKTAAGRADPVVLACTAFAHAPAGRAARPRHPEETLTCETFWPAMQPIFDLLPHMDKNDIHKLGYFCPGDFNKDDVVDDADVALFVATFHDETSPIFNWCDVNTDGVIDDADTAEFLRLFTEGGCDPEAWKIARSQIC